MIDLIQTDIIARSKLSAGDTILETNLGSGSSAIAAFDAGFDYVGLEIHGPTLGRARIRLSDHIHGGPLFSTSVGAVQGTLL